MRRALAAAQVFPSKAITLICPWSAGGIGTVSSSPERATIERVGLLAK